MILLTNLIINVFHRKNVSKELLSLAKLTKAEDFTSAEYFRNKMLNDIFSNFSYDTSVVTRVSMKPGSERESTLFDKNTDSYKEERRSRNEYCLLNDRETQTPDLSSGVNLEDLTLEIKEEAGGIIHPRTNSIPFEIRPNNDNKIGNNLQTSEDIENQPRKQILDQSEENMITYNNVYLADKLSSSIELQQGYDNELIDYLLNVKE